MFSTMECGPSTSTNAAHLQDTIRHKVNITDQNYPARESIGAGNKNAWKDTRRVEIGWMDFNEKLQQFKQVRAARGGGTRHLQLPKDADSQCILREGQMLFFPGGSSQRGALEDFHFTVQDFRGRVMTHGTIGELYDIMSIKMLRLYVCTRQKEKKKSNSPMKPVDKKPLLTSIDLLNTSEGATTDMVRVQEGRDFNSVCRLHEGSAATDFSDLGDKHLFIPGTNSTKETDSAHRVNESILKDENYRQNLPERRNNVSEPQNMQPSSREHNSSSDISPSLNGDQRPVTIRLHRSNVRYELISMFKAANLIDAPLQIEFVDEAGAEARDISKDAFACFWNSFFCSHVDSEELQVPALCPELGNEEWKAVGRILVKGYIDHKVLPLQLAPAFFVALLFGEEEVTPNLLLDSFLLYLCESDRVAVRSALAGNLTEEEKKLFVALLNREGSLCVSTPQEAPFAIRQLAHKCIIQNSFYALQCMREGARRYLVHHFPSPSSVIDAYRKLQPMAKTARDTCSVFPSTKKETRALRFEEISPSPR